jgi:hypothetical protein
MLNAGLIEGRTGLIAWYASAVAEAAFDEVSSLDLYFGDLDDWSQAACEDILSDAFDDEALGWYRGGVWKRLGQVGVLRVGGRVDLPRPFGAGTFVMPHFQVELTRLATERPYGRVASFIVPQRRPRPDLRERGRRRAGARQRAALCRLISRGPSGGQWRRKRPCQPLLGVRSR